MMKVLNISDTTFLQNKWISRRIIQSEKRNTRPELLASIGSVRELGSKPERKMYAVN